MRFARRVRELLVMMLMICAEVLQRSIPLLNLLPGLPWADEMSEYMLYLITLLPAPWRLRQYRHIRVDIVLLTMPARLDWYASG
jgi:TRAP-type transport system small permease protein